MLTLAPAASSRPVTDADVNCTPWSVLKTSGQPRRNASSNAFPAPYYEKEPIAFAIANAAVALRRNDGQAA